MVIVSPHLLARLLRPGQTIYLPGSSGEPTAFVNALLAGPGAARGIEVLTSFTPGVNFLDFDKLDPSARVSGLFTQRGWTIAQRMGRYRHLPLSYTGFVRHIRELEALDLAVVQVAPPDATGRCSLGPAVEFLPVVLAKCRRVLGLINHRTPSLPGAPSLALADFDHLCEVDTPLVTYARSPDVTAETVARNVAALIGDGRALQLGLGRVPAGLPSMLRDRRGLRLHSGLLSDGIMELADAGALAPSFPHTACVLVGSASFYNRLSELPMLHVGGCDVTHDARTLAGIDGLIAVNSAIEVDLFGNCNLEREDGLAVSGGGGVSDFARGARVARGGLSVIALTATRRSGTMSRIVPVLGEGAMTTLGRADVDVVVTEYGVAELGRASVHERAEALIAVAAPEHRDHLTMSWRAIAARL